ncbi:glycosyltransferase [Methanolobus sediminis]|uniref:Glycosyltransferase n=1 Tax=Methanolobus sediminis TaxID=3072978 RepID=A0AA51UL98_9EURY|nr:glycosyltransferase [Methanolobus sediminis]WMW25429.1 glycosyltransferase [Methanolobus sediminis]
MVNVIYYYPKRTGAPSKVALSLFNAYLDINKKIHFYIFQQTFNDDLVDCTNTKNIERISLKKLLFEDGNYLVHFTLSPSIFPNKKFILYIISLLKKNKIIINYHGEPRTEFLIKVKNRDLNFCPYILNYIFLPFILKKADKLIVNSYNMKSLFEQKYDLNNVLVIRNGIASFWLDPLDNKNVDNINELDNMLSQTNLTILYHGRLAPEKGIEVLLQGFALFVKQCSARNEKCPINLILVGEGPLKDKMYSFCVDNMISQYVIFMGFISDISLKYMLEKVDATIYPSIYEPFSLAVLEALSTTNGPVIYAENIGINDFAKKYNYELHTFKPTPEIIANEFSWILENQNNPEVIKLIKAQKEFSTIFSWNSVAKEYLELYNAV